MLNEYTEGDSRENKHAIACRKNVCEMRCQCWCHGITRHENGDLRDDAYYTLISMGYGYALAREKKEAENGNS